MRGSWRLLALVSQLGLTLALSVLIGLGLGIWLDNVLGTRPLFILALSLIGISAGSLAVYRLVAAAIAEAEVDLESARRRPGRGDQASPGSEPGQKREEDQDQC